MTQMDYAKYLANNIRYVYMCDLEKELHSSR